MSVIEPGQVTLVFSGTTIGDHVQSWIPVPTRLTPVAEVQNLWASTIIQDGSYPALRWEHRFRIFTDQSSWTVFPKYVTQLNSLRMSDPGPLTLLSSASTVAGLHDCYLTQIAPESPNEFLEHSAGFLQVTFIGKTQPSFPA